MTFFFRIVKSFSKNTFLREQTRILLSVHQIICHLVLIVISLCIYSGISALRRFRHHQRTLHIMKMIVRAADRINNITDTPIRIYPGCPVRTLNSTPKITSIIMISILSAPFPSLPSTALIDIFRIAEYPNLLYH